MTLEELKELADSANKTKGPNSRTNPIGYKYLDFDHDVTRKYVEKGFYVNESGQIYDTLFWPGDEVTIKLGLEAIIKSVRAGVVYKIEDITYPAYYNSTRIDLATYRTKSGSNYGVNVSNAGLKLVGIANKILANKFIGAKNMTLQLEQNKPTFVREFTETISDNKVVRSYVGEQKEFNTLSVAKNFVSTSISESIRKDNLYRKFAVFQEVYVAQAKQPEVEFV